MANKMQKYMEERERNAAKIALLKERNNELERKIAETESMEIRALMRSENITLEELVTMARSMQGGGQAVQPQPPATYATQKPEEDEDDDEDDE